jgi:DNA repair protein RecO
MPTYGLTAIIVGGFPIGESDKVVSMFSSERGLVRAVAKGAKKPGTKMAGKSEALCANKLMIATGRSLDIITQAESIATFRNLRSDLVRLTYSLYYAELTQAFGEGLEEESEIFYQVLFNSLHMQEAAVADARLLSLEFEMFLLRQLGVSPELQACIKCRRPLTEYNITVFYLELGGIGCDRCGRSSSQSGARVAEKNYDSDAEYEDRGTFVTPLVWKMLVNADSACEELVDLENATRRRPAYTEAQSPALDAAHRLMQRNLENRAGKKMRTLDLLKQF